MATGKKTSKAEELGIKAAINRLTEAGIANAATITKLEEQNSQVLQTLNDYQQVNANLAEKNNQILRTLENYKEETANFTKNEIQTMSDQMSERIDSMTKMYEILENRMKNIL